MAIGPWQTFRIDEHPDFKSLPKDRCTLTMLQGPTPGAIQPVVADELVLGRGDDLPARIDDRGISRHHARVHRLLGEWCVEDLDSTNGTLVNGVKITRVTRLRDGDRIQLGETTLLKVALQDATEAEAVRKLYDSAVKDPLTGIHNRGFFDERLGVEFAYAKRHGQPLSVMLLDLDFFKRVNDTWGHQAGDLVLQSVSATVASCIRAEDVFARYGGEELVIIARGLEPGHALAFAERIRATIEAQPIPWTTQQLNVTASIGVGMFDAAHPFAHEEELLAAADRAVYQAKNEGRNRVVMA
jgi:diguanylate cyclase (GGDEF)-like protein